MLNMSEKEITSTRRYLGRAELPQSPSFSWGPQVMHQFASLALLFLSAIRILVMSASTSRVTLRAISRRSRSGGSLHGAVSKRQGDVLAQGPLSMPVRPMSSQPKQIGKGKENERYNYNTSMSFSDEIDPDVSLRSFWLTLRSLIQPSMSIIVESLLQT